MDFIRNMAVAIDNLRISKGLTVRELCLNICDESAYRRYRSGDRDIPIAKVQMFCDKLGLGLDEFLSNVYSKNSYEFKKIHKLFTYLQNKEYDLIKRDLPLIDINQITLDRDKTLYYFILHTYNFETKKITKSEYYDLLLELLPNNDGFYTFNQVIILEKLALIEVQNDDSTSLNKLQNILLNTKNYIL